MSKDLHMEMSEEELSKQESGLTLELQSLMQADKARITDVSQNLVDKVAKGMIDPVKAFIHAKKIHETATLLVENLRPYLNAHLNVAKGETLTMYNIEFTQAELGVKYDYKSCGDPEYEEIMKEFEKIDKRKKAKEKELKGITKARTELDEDTGELIKINPPIKTGAMGYKTELK